MSEFIKFSVSEDLRVLQDETIKRVSKIGKIKIGINEVTKAIERGNAKFVIIAEDVSPVEIVMHIPIIAKEKKITFSYSKTKEDLGKSVGISAKASCIAVLDAGSLQKELTTLIDKIEEVSGSKKTVVTEEKPKVAEVKEEKLKVAEVKEEKLKVAEVKEEKSKVAEVKEEKPKVTEVKEEKSKVTEVKEEKPKVTEVKEEKPKVAEVKKEKSKVAEVKEEKPKVTEVKEEKPKVAEVKKEKPKVAEVKKEISENKE